MPNAYVSSADADQWFAQRQLNHWHEQPADLRTASLLRASEWIDRSFTFVGQPETPDQERAWPRMNAFLTNGQAINGIPAAVIDAVYILAEALIEDDQAGESALGLGQHIIGHKAAGVEIRYEAGQDNQTRIQRLLSPLLERRQIQQSILRS